jgi:hypothetical protein
MPKWGSNIAADLTMEEVEMAYSDAAVWAVCGYYQSDMGASNGGGFQRLRLGGGGGGLQRL